MAWLYSFIYENILNTVFHCVIFDHLTTTGNGSVLDDDILGDTSVAKVLEENAGRVQKSMEIRIPIDPGVNHGSTNDVWL